MNELIKKRKEENIRVKKKIGEKVRKKKKEKELWAYKLYIEGKKCSSSHFL